MKQLFTVVAACSLGTICLSQEQNVVGTSGSYTENASGSVSWTIGEVIIETGTGGTHEATQGFHQSNIWVLGVEELSELEISIYPNPTSDFVNIKTEGEVMLSIYDMSGRLINSYHLTEETNQINVDQYSRGTYNMVFETEGQKSKTARLVVQ
jgi:hypothetical protein